ncbi:hypothetical protein ACHWQZ_G016628 [Mnemiopsis leidyi]
MSKSLQAGSKSSSELVVGVALTVSPSLIRTDVVELYEEENRPMVLNRSLLQSPLTSRYEFTHKAIWAVSLPQTNPTWDAIKCYTVGPALPDLEHWVFVAKGHFPGLPDMDAYFIAQFNSDSYIPTAEERKKEKKGGVKKYHFAADLVEKNKRHAALLLCTTKEKTHVWVYLQDNTGEWKSMGDILKEPKGELVSGNFNESQWKMMSKPLKLGEINDLMYKTSLVGQEYTPADKNCQLFAKDMYRLAS